MNQLALFAPAPRARRTDPASSRDAARKAVAFAGTHEEKIVGYLTRIYPRAAHAEQIGHAIGLRMEQVDRRRSALITAGKIEIAGEGVFSNGNRADLLRWVPITAEVSGGGG